MQFRYHLLASILLAAACVATALSQPNTTFQVHAYAMVPLPTDSSKATLPNNGTLNATVLPSATYACTNSSVPAISREEVYNLLGSTFLLDSVMPGMIANGTGYIWKFLTSVQSTQIYMCNYGRDHGVPFSVGMYRLANEVLDERCGDSGGWVYLDEWKLQIGRGPTTSVGEFVSACGWDLGALGT